MDKPSGGEGSSAAQLRDKASEVGQNLRDMGAQAREVASEQVNQLRDTASQYYQQGRERAMEFEQNFEDYVRQQPVKSVLIAAGVGVLLGILWRRS